MKKIGLAVLVLFAVAACGFEPLYVQKTSKEDKWYFDGDFDNYVTDRWHRLRL